MKNEYIPILKLSLPSNIVSLTGTNKPIPTEPKLIGRGSFGMVYSVSDDQVYKKIKVITTSSEDFAIIENNVKEFSFYKMLLRKNERSFTSSIYLPYIPNSIVVPKDIKFKYPFMYIEMSNYGIPLSKIEYTSFETFKIIFKQLIECLQTLNNNNMSHGDLKPNNILIDNNNNATIIDYGSICFFHSKSIKNKYQRCTIFYVSPEELITGNYSLYNDWWSLGVIMFEFYTKKCFIKTLLETIKIKDSDISTFIDYSLHLKTNDSFDPKSFLINVYTNLNMSDIITLIDSNIKEKDLVYILNKLLVIDPKDRNKNKNKVLDYFEYIDPSPKDIELVSAVSLKEYSYYNFKQLSNNTRKSIVKNTFKICEYYEEFGKEIIGHSIMLFDRFFFRSFSTNNFYNPYIYNILCIIVSSMLIKGETFRGSSILNYMSYCYGINCSLKEIQEYMLILLDVLNYSLLCLPPDMLYNFDIDYSKLYKVYSTYPLINNYIYELFKLIPKN